MNDTDRPFRLRADYRPAGDQPEAIARLVDGLENGLAHQTLLGVTGSGKSMGTRTRSTSSSSAMVDNARPWSRLGRLSMG